MTCSDDLKMRKVSRVIYGSWSREPINPDHRSDDDLNSKPLTIKRASTLLPNLVIRICSEGKKKKKKRYVIDIETHGLVRVSAKVLRVFVIGDENEPIVVHRRTSEKGENDK